MWLRRPNTRSNCSRAPIVAAPWANWLAPMPRRNSARTMSFPLTNATISAYFRKRAPLQLEPRRITTTYKTWLRRCGGLGSRADVLEDPHVDAMNDVVGPPVPVGFGPHGMRIPGRTFNPGAPARQFGQQKLALVRLEVAVEMLGRNVAVRGELVHGSRIGGDPEPQQMRLVPNRDGFDEGSGRKNTVADCTRSAAGNFGAHGVGNSSAENSLLGRRDLRKGDDFLPNLLGRCVHLDCTL